MNEKWMVLKGENFIEVEDVWLDNIERKGITNLELSCGSEKLIVTYYSGCKNEKVVSFDNVHGTWGFGTTLS